MPEQRADRSLCTALSYTHQDSVPRTVSDNEAGIACIITLGILAANSETNKSGDP